MEKEMSERMAVVENRLDNHDTRLARHGERIDILQQQNIKQDGLLTKLCKNQEINNELTHSIKGAVTTVKWMVAGATSLIGLWVAVKQLGVF